MSGLARLNGTIVVAYAEGMRPEQRMGTSLAAESDEE